MSAPKRTLVIVCCIIIVGSTLGWFWSPQRFAVPRITSGEFLPHYTAEQLRQYDGSVEGKPIYIGLDGYVYDVTKGAKFYQVGGVYHRIAGTDATVLLRVFGAQIIRDKYRIVGILDIQ